MLSGNVMKTSLSPSQLLARDRRRKTLYRDARYQEGWRQHTLWTTDEGWQDILVVVTAAGPGKVRGLRWRGQGEIMAKAEGQVVMEGREATPAHTSDMEVPS